MKESDRDNLTKKYPWLSVSNSVEEYVSPDYYQKLLKEYSFEGISDVKYLETYISKLKPSTILELGCGSGRATKIPLKKFPSANFTLVDLSERMIDFSKKRFGRSKIKFETLDAVNFLKKTKEQYDLVYSLWSFSHSVHQHVHNLGFDDASRLLRKTLTKFIRKNLKSGGKFFLMHFDSMSDEQRILMRQWKRVFPEFSNLDQQSPSKRILDSVLWDLDNKNEITLSVSHLTGDKILYSSENEVLEIFLNFHMETYFNKTPLLQSVINDVTSRILPYRQSNGMYAIQPGCYIYSFEKK